MYLKPRNSVLNPPALLYRRYNEIVIAQDKTSMIQTSDLKWWVFDANSLTFSEVDATYAAANTKTYPYTTGTFPVAVFAGNQFSYSESEGWQPYNANSAGSLESNFCNMTSAFIAKYQINRYYFVRAFDYMRSDTEDGATIQPIKGLVTPIHSFDIRTYDDVSFNTDDFVVLDGHLYSVENPSTSIKMLPRPFTITSVTLNSIL